MPFAVSVTLNGTQVILGVFPTLAAAQAAAKASPFADAKVVVRKA